MAKPMLLEKEYPLSHVRADASVDLQHYVSHMLKLGLCGQVNEKWLHYKKKFKS